MSSFTLKMIAIITMVIDHIGACFFPNQQWIRYIGRLSFPIFAFLLAEGFIHTSNRRQYTIRLGLFALISEVPYDLCFRGSPLAIQKQNIFFELLCGFAVLMCIKKAAKNKGFILLIPLLALVSEYLFFSYGAYGIALIAVFYLLRENTAARAAAGAAVTLIFNGIMNLKLPGGMYILSINTIQMWAVGSALPLLLYNGKKGAHSLRWFFYIFYPAHLLIIFFYKACSI